MKKLIFLLLFININFLFSQEKSSNVSSSNDKVYYTVRPNFPVNVQNIYVLIDSTDIERVFSDGSKEKYKRILKYYFSLWAPSPPNKEKQLSVYCSVDSLEYWLITKDSTYFYNSQADDIRLLKHEDFQILISPLGLEFEMVYSPYWDVGKIGGEIYEERMNLIKNPEYKISDHLKQFTWEERLSKYPLLHYFDIVKGLYPYTRVFIDSVWTAQVIHNIEGVNIIDSVNFKLANFNIKNFFIEGESFGVSPLKDNYARLFNIPILTNPNNVGGKSFYRLKLHPKGTIEDFTIDSHYNLEYKVEKDIIIQNIKNLRHWKLLGSYRI